MNRYSDMTIWSLREEMKALQAELATRDVTPRPTPPALPDEAGEIVAFLLEEADDLAHDAERAERINENQRAENLQEYERKYRQVASFIERLAPRWISVEERLPGDMEIVQVWGESEDEDAGWSVAQYDADEKDWHFRFDGGCVSLVTVTHWQPLPLPPQKGST